MCPACLTTAAIVLLGATTTGGVTAILVKKVLQPSDKPQATPSNSSIEPKERHHE